MIDPMSPSFDPLPVMAFILSAMSFAGTVYTVAFKVAKIDSRVELLWTFLLRVGYHDALSGGAIRRESPLRLHSKLLNEHSEFIDRAKAFYQKEGFKMSDTVLVEELEKRFGIEMSKITAGESGMTPIGCLMAIAFLLRPEMPLLQKLAEIEDRNSNR